MAENTNSENINGNQKSTDQPNAYTNTDSNYEDILKLPFSSEPGQADSKTGKECIDVVTEYYWVQNKPKPTGLIDKNQAVPFLYATEYRQRYGTTATNLYNGYNGFKTMADSILSNSGEGGKLAQEIVKGIGNAAKTVGEKFLGGLETMGSWNWVLQSITDPLVNLGNGLKNVVTGQNGKIFSGNTHLNSKLLSPYYYLYSLQTTNKQYCFPFLGDDAASWQIANGFGDGNVSALSQAIVKGVEAVTNQMPQFAADVQDFMNLFSNPKSSQGNTGFSMYNVEKAKAFQFPSGGKTVSVKFPLFNTLKKDEWKKNYRFIVLFGLRNMLYRKNNVQYYPPLIYDVSIPGFGRLPLSYVKTFSVKPVGMTRIKSMDLGLLPNVKSNVTTSVIVPEAWIVQIDFESLIADSANLFLSSMIDLPIQASVVDYT